MKLIQTLGTLSFVLVFASGLCSGNEASDRLDKEISAFKLDGMIRTAIGVTRDDTPIPAFVSPEDFNYETKKFRILLVGGLDGNVESTRAVLRALQDFQKLPEKGKHPAVSAVPCARPDSLGAEEFTPFSFPPKGNAYNQPENDVAHYLWRWTGMHAPDLVVVVWTTGKRLMENPNSVGDVQDKVPFLGDLPQNGKLFKKGSYQSFGGSESGAPFAVALSSHWPLEKNLANAPSETGGIQAWRYHIVDGIDGRALVNILLEDSYLADRSNARKEIRRRIARSPIEVARQLDKVYGHKLDSIMYIPSLAVIGRLRFGDLSDEPRLKRALILAAPYHPGKKESMPAKGNGSTLSGHLLFSELARRTSEEEWTALATKAADYGFDESGKPKESMPFHNEMSDSVFMGCAILAEVGALTGEQKYYDQCLRHLKFMEKLCLRDDGIYRHSPLDEAAWGRGNGFPALGMALSLSALPENSEAFAHFLKSYRAHLEALRKHQDPTGAWHQVIDHEESYREFTSTCMITFAIVRGIRRGWLDEKEWAPVVEKAWRAIKSRIGPNGRLVDVCTGTGKQKNLRAYFDRTAILGPDDRGGAMALMVSTEIAFWERER